MGYQVYRVKKTSGGYRFAGYGVPAICEHPDCNKEIDRGMSYACGGEPFSDFGCDRYFCEAHLHYTGIDETKGAICRHRNDCDCESVQLCDKCRDPKSKGYYPYKEETKEWCRHVLKDASWKEWRDENPEMVEDYKKIIAKKDVKLKKQNK